MILRESLMDSMEEYRPCILDVMDLIHSYTMTPLDTPGKQDLKTLWEKEKLIVMSNFSLSNSVFYLFGQLSAIFVKFKIVVCKLFQFGRV